MKTPSLTHAGCVVFRGDIGSIRYLVVSSSTGIHWVLPKGHIDPGETPGTAALRELEEETGITGGIVRPLSIQRYTMPREEVVVQYYLVRMTGSKIPMENRKIRWEDGESALKLLSFAEAQNALHDAKETFI
jgi:8-oxo-dGTP pyrophosphatase MutT (NUDIX family)